MSQPPGPYDEAGDPERAPRPYGPVVRYWQVSAPPRQRPPERELLTWLVVGGAVLLAAIWLFLVVLLAQDERATAERVQTSAPSAASSSVPSSPSPGTVGGELPDGEPRSTDPAAEAFGGDDGVAPAVVGAEVRGDRPTA